MSNPELPASLCVRRIVRASAERAFAAWTDPKQVVQWWGPAGVSCAEAHIDLRVGGSYGIANEFPDGRIVWIRGTFEIVEPPHQLAFSWRLDGDAAALAERVTVSFVERSPDSTEIVVLHERVEEEERRKSHEAGWVGCLDGLAMFLDVPIDASCQR